MQGRQATARAMDMLSIGEVLAHVDYELGEYYIANEEEFTHSSLFTFGSNTYQVINIPKSWHEANAYATDRAGHLVTITSQAEQHFLESLITNMEDSWWIGAYRIATHGANQFAWVTGEPNNVGGTENRVEMTVSGRWNDLPEDRTLGFIIEWSAPIIEPPPIVVPPPINELPPIVEPPPTIELPTNIPDVNDDLPPGNTIPAPLPIVFTNSMQANGAQVLLVRGGSTLMQARAFTDQFGGTISASGGVVTATGINLATGEQRVIQMTIGLPFATIDGGLVDIATFVGQPTLEGQIVPITESGRTYVPVRFLANAFGIPFRSVSGGVEFN